MNLENHARDLLGRLLDSAEKSNAGLRSRPPSITSVQLRQYLDSRSLEQRQSFEAIMASAADAGAVNLERERGYAEGGEIRRVNLADLTQLATFLGRSTQEALLAATAALFAEGPDCPMLAEVMAQWRSLKKVRGTGPERAVDWRDALRVIEHMKGRPEVLNGELPVREVSARIFNDSKRIERLVALIDVLVSGSLSPEVRHANTILAEIGLGREEAPVRLAGQVSVRRERVCSLLDTPYGAFPAATVLGIEGAVEAILTIENQTTFHSGARRGADTPRLLIYTGGMPSPAWMGMYARLLRSAPADIPVEHWGDVDEGGFRIASVLSRAAADTGRRLLPHRMRPSEVLDEVRQPAPDAVVERMAYFAAQAGWGDLSDEIRRVRIVVEQEALD